VIYKIEIGEIPEELVVANKKFTSLSSNSGFGIESE
jgi:hypothetical protein